MATACECEKVRRAVRWVLGSALALGLAGVFQPSLAQDVSGQGAGGGSRDGAVTPSEPYQIDEECRVKGVVAGAPLRNLQRALGNKSQLRILTIGSANFADPDALRGGRDADLEQIIEQAIRGLDVRIIHRGVSGELAAAAGERLKIEVALTRPHLVLWQVGTADAFARIPIRDFAATLTSTLAWLRGHDVDVVLVGLNYLREWSRDPYYQEIRKVIRQVSAKQNVLRIGRYHADAVISRAMEKREQGVPNPFERVDAGYVCMSQYIARALTVGLFANAKKHKKPGRAKLPPQQR